MNTQAILAATRKAIAEHGLDYTARVSPRMTKTYGVCNYTHRTITISGPLAAVNTDAETMNTILHEVAHALAGHRAGHGPAWKAVAASIGARPEPRYSETDVVAVASRYEGRCNACGRTVSTRNRMTPAMKRLTHKPSMCAVGYDANRSIAWVDTRTTAPTAPTVAPVVAFPTPRPTVRVAASAPTATPTTTPSTTITCTGTCGATKDATKFPTTGKGGRGTECRECQKARRANA